MQNDHFSLSHIVSNQGHNFYKKYDILTSSTSKHFIIITPGFTVCAESEDGIIETIEK